MKRTLAFVLLACACDPTKITFPDDSDAPDDPADSGDPPPDSDVVPTDSGADSDDDSGADSGDDSDDSGPTPVTGPLDRVSGEAPLTDQSDATLVGESTMNYAGYLVQHAGDVDGDGYGDVLTTTNQAYGTSGGIYLVRGPISGEQSLSDADGIVRAGSEGGTLGVTPRALSSQGDLDGDGYTDVTVSDCVYSGSHSTEGRVWLLSGPLDGESTLTDAAGTVTGSTYGDGLGAEVVHMDLDGDGQDDLLSSAQGNYTDPTNEGSVVVMRGPLSGARTHAAPDAELVGAGAGDGAGSALSTGDYNGDGAADLVVGARGVDTSAGSEVGAAFIVYGPVTDSVYGLEYADAVVYGTSTNSHAGEDVWSAGDTAGDGYEDLATSAPWVTTSSTSQGAIYVFTGPIAGDQDTDSATASFVAAGIATPALYTQWTSADLDLDGFDDGVMSSASAERNQGAVFLNYGPLEGSHVIDDGGSDAVWTGDKILSYFLLGVDARGDVDGDGAPDLLVGASASVGDAAATAAGRAHILFGGAM